MPAIAPIIGQIAINAAIGIGASVLATILTPQQKTKTQKVETSRGFSFDLQVGESVAVSAVLGLGRARGQLIFVNEYGQDNEYVQLVIKVGHGWHDGMEAFLLDEKPVTFSGSNADARGRQIDELKVEGTPYGWVKYYTGAPGQAADPELVAHANPSTRWTAAHKMTGCAYYILTFRYHPDLFGSTLPLSGSIWRGLRLYDWREAGAVWGDQSTYVFTKNPAVIRYNFRRGIYVNGVRILGQGFSTFANDMAGYTAAANRCDEDFYDPDSDTTFPIYEFGREVGDDEEKLTVLAELDAAYCGSSFKRGGADVPLPAQQLVSVLTLNDADRMAGYPVRADKKGSVSAKKTMWHGQFVSEDIGWALAPFTPRINSDLESVLGGRRSVAMDQPYESLQQRAQLRAEMALRRQFYPASRVETFTPKAFVLEPGDPVTRVCEWGSVLMVVEKVERVMVEGRWIAVTVTMSEWNNAIVPASGDSFIDLPQEPGTGPADPSRTIAVSGLSVVSYQRQGGGAEHPYARGTWAHIDDPNVDQVMIRVWPSAGTEANDREDFFANAHLQDALVFGPLQPETEYTYKAIPVRSDARLCVWTNTGTFTTGIEGVPLGDETVGFAQIKADIEDFFRWTAQSNAKLRDDIQSVVVRLQDQAGTNLDTFQQVRQSLTATAGDLKADYNSTITAAVGVVDGKLTAVTQRVEVLEASYKDPITGNAALASGLSAINTVVTTQGELISANADAITSVEASVDDVSAGGSIRFQSAADPGGGYTRIALAGYASGIAGFVQAGLFVDVNGTTGVGRLALAANQTVITAPDGTLLTLFDASSGTAYINNARIHNLDADNIDVEALTATTGFFDNLTVTWAMIGDVVANNFVATSANIGSLSVDRLKIANGAVTDYVSDTGAGGSLTIAEALVLTGSDFAAPDGPFLVSGKGSASVPNGTSPTCSVVLLIRDRVTNTLSQIASVTGTRSASLNHAGVVGNLVSGRNYRLELQITGSNDSNSPQTYGAWVTQATIPRK